MPALFDPVLFDPSLFEGSRPLFDPAIFDPRLFETGFVPPSDSSDVDNALMFLLQSDPILTALAPDGVFWDEAGPSIVTGGNSTRFVLVSLVSEHDDPIFEGCGDEDALYLVKAVALSTSGGNVKAAAARINALLNPNTVLTIPGYHLMVVRRVERVRMTEVDDQDASIRWYHRGGRYQVMAAPILS